MGVRGWVALGLCWGLWLPAASAQTVLLGADGTPYTVNDNRGGDLSTPPAFEGWPRLCVRQCNGAACEDGCGFFEIYDGANIASIEELNGLQRRLTARQMGGLEVQRRVFVPSAGPASADSFVRYYDTFTNTTVNPITVMIRFGTVASFGGGRLGAGVDVSVWRTHNDDAVVEASDRWLLTDDADPNGGDAALMHLVFGAGARETPDVIALAFANVNDPAALAWDYRDVVIPAQATVALLTFIVHEPLRADAMSEGRNLIRMVPEALFGLTDPQLAAVYNFDVDPANASPTAEAGGPYTAREGDLIQVSAVGSVDPELQPLSYEWDLNDDGLFDDQVGSAATVTFRDNGVYRVAVRVTDAGGKTDVDTARVQVLNVPPSIDAIVTDSPIVEGGSVQVQVQASDPGDDVLTFDFDWDGDGQFEQLGAPPNLMHRYAADGLHNARVRVRDGDRGEAQRVFAVQVDNAPPDILQVITNSPQVEGAQVTLQVVANDRGGDPITYAYDLDGDGLFEISEVGRSQVQTVYAQDGNYDVGIRLTDDGGGQTEAVETIVIRNGAPTIEQVSNDGPVVEGQTARITVQASDPGGDPLRFDFDLDGDGAFDIVDQIDPFVDGLFSQDGRFLVGVRVRDDSDGVALGDTEVVVTNADPVGQLIVPEIINEGVPFNVEVQASDPGDDVLAYSFDLDGDGVYEIVDVAQAVQEHQYERSGRRTIRARVRDGDGGELLLSIDVDVSNVPPVLEVRVEAPLFEGTEFQVEAIASDQGGAALTYSFDFEDDGIYEIRDQPESVAHWTYPDQGRYRIRVAVDDGGQRVDQAVDVLVENVAPTVVLEGENPTEEGTPFMITAQITEPGDDTIVISWDFDDDGQFEVLNDPAVLQAVPAPDDGRFTLRVLVQDEDGGQAEARMNLEVVNAPPSLLMPREIRPAVENQPYNIVVPAIDPGGANDPLVFSLVNPPPDINIHPDTGLFDWTPTYQQFLDSPMRITVAVEDDDGGRDELAFEIPVLPEDLDEDGLPDEWERDQCVPDGPCLDPSDPDDGAADPDGDGRDNRQEFEEGTDPFRFEGPEQPTLVAPGDGARLDTLQPDLEVTAVDSSYEGGPISIEFELYGDAELSDQVIAEAVRQGEAGTIWTVPPETLVEDTQYWWRVRAVSGDAASAWTEAWSFLADAANTPPEAPRLSAPEDGAVVDSLQPRLQAFLAKDLDGDELRYVFTIYRGDADDPVVLLSGEGTVDAEAEVVWFQPESNLIEDAALQWDVIAQDLEGVSPPSERWSFTIDTANSAPTEPEIVAPAEGEVVDSHTPTIEARGSTDVDSIELDYYFRIRDEAGEIVDQSEAVLAAGSRAAWTVEVPLDEDAEYRAEVFVSDRITESMPVSVSFFVSVSDDPPPTPELLGPADGSTLFDERILTWEAVADPERQAVTYTAVWCPAQGGADGGPPDQEGCTRREDLTSPSTALEALEAGATYVWTVVALDPAGNESPAGAWWRFSLPEGGGDDGGCSCDSSRSTAPLLLLLPLLLGLRRRRLT